MSKYIDILQGLISLPSFSREETAAADFLQARLTALGLDVHRKYNNLWCESVADRSLPLLLLNAHIDTVRPASGYTRDPFRPSVEDGRLYGLGSNDDGGSIVALLEAYLELSSRPQPYRMVLSFTAEEEVCGKNGIEALFPEIGPMTLGVMGEPTGMRLAVAERGLMVLDCEAVGKSGHAARDEGINAIYGAIEDIRTIQGFSFDKVSPYLGRVKMTVTQINAGTQHNVVPDRCTFVVDVRSNGLYSNEELLSYVRRNVKCSVSARSTRLGSSHTDLSSPVVRRAEALGMELFGSPTTSNQAVSPFPTVKIGPGESSRSHTADEYILISEIDAASEGYVRLLDGLEVL